MHGTGPAAASGRLLHVGCGGGPLPDWLEGFTETRLDIDPGMKPDIVASMTDMGDIGEYDAILCNHALEHVYPHEVRTVLREFLRVLRSGGHAMVIVPDLEGVSATDETLYVSPGGPVSGLDMMYGMRRLIEANPHMAHHTGFMASSLDAAFRDAGFSQVVTKRIGHYNLLGVGVK